jgi:hypothetical protein
LAGVGSEGKALFWSVAGPMVEMVTRCSNLQLQRRCARRSPWPRGEADDHQSSNGQRRPAVSSWSASQSHTIFVDRGMWEKTVLNLLSSAFKFTFEVQPEEMESKSALA